MSSQTEPKTITLYGDGVQHEGQAGSAVTPGHFVNRTGGDTVEPGFGGAAMVATENITTGGGNTATPAIDTEYAAGEQVFYTTFAPSASVYALASAEVADGDNLAVQGDGTLAASAAGDVIIAKAREDAASGERVRVEITAGYSQPA